MALKGQRFKPRRWWWAALAGVAAAAFVIGIATRPGGSSVLAVGDQAPAWAGTTLSGQQLTSRDEQGKWVVLNFFATWCGPCQAETPQLVRFAAAHSSSQAQIVGVVYGDDSTADVRSFVASHHVTWPLLDGTTAAITSAYGVPGLPESFVISPQGKLAARIFGGVTTAGLDHVVQGAKAA